MNAWMQNDHAPYGALLGLSLIYLNAVAQERRGAALIHGPIALDAERYRVTVAGEPLHLTRIEFKILRTMLISEGRVVTRDELLKNVLGYDAEVQTRTLDTHIKRLRFKLGKAAEAIETVRSVGYRLRSI